MSGSKEQFSVRVYGDACDVIKPTQAEAMEGQSESWASFCLETGVSLDSLSQPSVIKQGRCPVSVVYPWIYLDGLHYSLHTVPACAWGIL